MRLRSVRRLRIDLEKRLGAYTAVGSVALSAGVAPSAHAGITYTPVRTSCSLGFPAVDIDLNHDGITDFSIQNFTSSFRGSISLFLDYLDITAASDNQVAVNGAAYAVALSPGQSIGPSLTFANGVAAMASFGSLLSFDAQPAVGTEQGSGGSFANVRNKFLGLKLSFNGKSYYGWGRVNSEVLLHPGGARGVSKHGRIACGLIDYAVEDTPDVPIKAGEGAIPVNPDLDNSDSLGWLAFGAGNPRR